MTYDSSLIPTAPAQAQAQPVDPVVNIDWSHVFFLFPVMFIKFIYWWLIFILTNQIKNPFILLLK
jgi:hypothetical protein